MIPFRNRYVYLLLSAMLIFLYSGAAFCAQADEERVAVADDFVVTQEYVGKLRKRMADPSATVFFTSTEEENRKAAIRIRLFAEEARRLGLDEAEKKRIMEENKMTQWNADEDSVEWHMTLAWRYITELIKEYSVEDVVVESYYRANQDKFYDPETGKANPLDDSMREDIRKWIALSKKSRIADQAYENLKKRYNLQICTSENNPCL